MYQALSPQRQEPRCAILVATVLAVCAGIACSPEPEPPPSPGVWAVVDTPIRTGQSNDVQIEVLSGLKEGDEIAAIGTIVAPGGPNE